MAESNENLSETTSKTEDNLENDNSKGLLKSDDLDSKPLNNSSEKLLPDDSPSKSLSQQSPKTLSPLESCEVSPTSDSRQSAVYENKELGKELYNKGDLQGAIDKWSISLKSISYILNKTGRGGSLETTQECLKEYTKMYVTLCLNLSLAYLKTNQYDKCKSHCQYVLMYDDVNLKAHLRIVQSDIYLKNYELALSNCDKGLKFHPGNTELKLLRNNILDHLARQKELDREFAKNIFRKIEPDPRVQYDPYDDLMKSRYFRFNYKILLFFYNLYQGLKKVFNFFWKYIKAFDNLVCKFQESVTRRFNSLKKKLKRS